MLASHHSIIVKSYVIVRLSYNYRLTVVRFSYDLASHQAIISRMSSHDYHTTIVRLSYDVVRFTYDFTYITDASQPIVSSVTTKLRLQYRSRIGENIRNAWCYPLHDVAGRCDQGFRGFPYSKVIPVFNTQRQTFQRDEISPKFTKYWGVVSLYLLTPIIILRNLEIFFFPHAPLQKIYEKWGPIFFTIL